MKLKRIATICCLLFIAQTPWSSANGEWTTIDPKWVTRIIGWIPD